MGPRTNASASRLLIGLKKLVHLLDHQRVRVTTDKLAAYRHALTKHFPAQSYVYLQIVKKRWHRRLVTVKKCFIHGTSEDFPEKTQNTSYIERFNLTLRLGCLKMATEAQFCCPGFGPRCPPTIQYLGTLSGCSAYALYSCGVQNSRHF